MKTPIFVFMMSILLLECASQKQLSRFNELQESITTGKDSIAAISLSGLNSAFWSHNLINENFIGYMGEFHLRPLGKEALRIEGPGVSGPTIAIYNKITAMIEDSLDKVFYQLSEKSLSSYARSNHYAIVLSFPDTTALYVNPRWTDALQGPLGYRTKFIRQLAHLKSSDISKEIFNEIFRQNPKAFCFYPEWMRCPL